MDISSMKSLLELQAIQNINTSHQPGSSTLSSSNSTLFSDLMSDILNGQSLNGLGDVGTLQQFTNTELQNSPTNNYIASFLLENSTNSTDSAGTQHLQATNVPPINLESYMTDYTRKIDVNNFFNGAEKYQAEITAAAKKFNIPEKLITAVMKQESNFNASAISSAGASGLMQLMPATASYLGVKDRFDPEQNIMGGAKYLRQMLDQFDNNIETALAAYNAGPGNVKKYGGIPPFQETQNYVKKVMNYVNV
ncbi:lytic transglycosylase domain-containing protein [Solibacillus merdavium]|uniref:Lytic transglycosylase domain-containing protein n=1 Tax=Solibacillus merdavium TaxID=2762218 RepID=A0ABR8XHV8_9BACL|nr:lytic transglycosylase domain-containing protein [Solibacillus merdavium]MBD8031520.1 lytic transglycosylase domain-containing protein [Solibacillus merdavium]